MFPDRAKKPAVVALAAAAALGVGYSFFRLPLRVRWIVARQSPPGDPEDAQRGAADLRAIGWPAKESLLRILRSPGGSRPRKSWVASILLEEPFFAQGEVEALLAGPDPVTARAAAYALVEGEGASPEDDGSVVQIVPRGGTGSRTSLEKWDPAPAVPVLIEWLKDRGDLEARHAARLLGRVPRGDPRVPEALLGVVEEMPQLIGPGAGNLQLRKMVAVNGLQSLLPYARDPLVVARVCRVIDWIEKNDARDAGWDFEMYALALLEASKGRGVEMGVLLGLARSTNSMVRQRLAGALAEIEGAGTTETLRDLVRDETETVRRAAVRAMDRKLDPAVLDLAPYLLEDSYIFLRADTLRTLGALRAVDSRRAREMMPLLVAAIEDPWPGGIDPGEHPMVAGGRAEVIEAAVLSLHLLTGRHPGFTDQELGADWKGRQRKCEGYARNAEPRMAEVVKPWRETVPPLPPGARLVPLAEHLDDRSPANILRAMRELQRLTGGSDGFPAAALEKTGDDTAARNAVREWMKSPDRAKVVERWKRRAAEGLPK